MILGDGLIGQMMEPVAFPEDLNQPPTNKDDWATNGMDTRKSNRNNIVKSLYLDAKVLNDHNLTLKAGYERMKREEVMFEAYNTDGEYKVLIVSYGTMSRVCKTAIDKMKETGLEMRLSRKAASR
jgi:2-oxoglutarate ferredoxin oxidoreductase subunit alpha